MTARCADCQAEYQTKDASDHGLCPACQRVEDRIYAIDRTPYPEDLDRPWPWSKAAMRERLGVTGDVDE